MTSQTLDQTQKLNIALIISENAKLRLENDRIFNQNKLLAEKLIVEEDKCKSLEQEKQKLVTTQKINRSTIDFLQQKLYGKKYQA